jgi:N-acetylglucosaminyldiphosphoundecaprenol N-acetyl-beta-D-mannosaminyltransferase
MSKQHGYDSVDILNVSVDVLSLSEAIGYIIARACQADAPGGYVVKPYVEFFDKAANDRTLQDLLNRSELAIADGIAVIWAAHYLYAGPHTLRRFWKTLGQIIVKPSALARPLSERAAGIDFTWPLLRAAADAKCKVFLIGKETPEDIAAVARTIRSTIPDIQIVGTCSGRDLSSVRDAASEAWIERTATAVRVSDAQLTLVGMGFPLQERVSAKLAALVGSGIFVGEGGTFDYASFGGSIRKAPSQIQRLGLEWAWRLLLQPSRVVRQLAIPRFIYRIWRSG